MNKKEKLPSAIAGAIACYLKQEEEEGARALGSSSRAGAKSFWGLSARQDAMQLRRLYQLRIRGR